MKQLNTPPSIISYITRHRSVVNSKNNTINREPNRTKENLLSLDADVSARYTSFESALQNNTLFRFPENRALKRHKEDLLSCYVGRTAKVKEIFQLIESSQIRRVLKKCPYCGITLPKTYDHYLPEAKFPELSVHALNLIPCCGTCNQTKSDNWKNAQHRTFLHYYVDVIPNAEYLKVELHTLNQVNSVGATFSIQRPRNIADSIWNVINSHYEKLGLIGLYNDYVNDEIAEIFDICVCHLEEGGSNIRNFIVRLSATEERLYGVNHWRVVLMKSLSNNQDFIDIVESEI